ncbi:hypothetical protein GCM10022291_31180 [Postechiella marina]|uniref:HTH araC/xylS-type domain-containing protein n=1 Tax=Postechiella marina TaxID=943941 RepID=A0ABP8CGN9_9FLAO
MDNTTIISIISLIIVVLFLFFAVFLVSVKTTKKLSNKLLASFLVVTAVDISVFFYASLIELHPVLEMLRIQLSCFKDPLLFLYILSVIYSDFKLKPKHLLLLTPWVICLIILIPNFFSVSEANQTAFLQNYSQSFEARVIRQINRVVEILYIIAEIYYLIRYRKLLLENYTSKEAFYNYHWLKQLIIFILVGQALTFLKGYIRDSGAFEVEIVNIYRVILLVFGLFFSFWLVFKALLSPKLFRGIGIDLKLAKEMISEKEDTANNKQHTQIEKLKAYMATEAPYLDASLSVQSLSDQVGIPPRELSILINQELNQHFFDFINSFRIEKAKEILENPAKNKQTVLEILYEVGFNSKSSFNTAFKKHTGNTPTSYRKITQNQ